MADQSNEADPSIIREAAEEIVAAAQDDNTVDESAEEEEVEGLTADGATSTKKKRRKKSKKNKVDQSPDKLNSDTSSERPGERRLEMVDQLLAANPALKAEMAGMPKETAVESLKKMDVSKLLSNLAISGKNKKDMSAYKFWQTQPVPRFDETQLGNEGTIQEVVPEQVAKQATPLPDGFEWSTLDLTDDKELREVHELLNGHYVEDGESQFRLNYSFSFLNWALKAPGWLGDWHRGVRASQSRKLVAFISAIPVSLRVRQTILKASEVNFLCIHKKLRSKRLTPVLIKEITRQCNLKGVYQAVYTAGIVLPTPISTCRYFHRSLDWLKLFEVGFAGLPHGSTKARQVTKNYVPERTSLAGIRSITKEDVPAVTKLLTRYLARFAMAPEFTDEEVLHWFVHNENDVDQACWGYVVEDPISKQITDFMSFYLLESLIIGNQKHENVRAAYMFYYASEAAFAKDVDVLKRRLNDLASDALILAKKQKFDVFNALTLLDNPLFLEQLKFQPGDGQLHYYLYNHRSAPIPGGVNERNMPDESKMAGVGLVML